MSTRRMSAIATVFAAVFPVLSAGRAACCKPAAPAAPHACCASKTAVATAVPKGCCKPPAAPKPVARADDGTSPAVAATPLHASGPSFVTGTIPAVAAILRARREHRAPSPDDSPPDLLAKTRLLLI